MIANLLLDWSGTLVDDFTATLVATNKVFEHYGLESLSEEEFRRDFRLPYPDFYQEFLPDAPLDELEFLFKKYFLEAEHCVQPLPFTRSFLAKVQQQGVRLFVLSSMNEEALLRQAKDFGLTDYFEVIYAGVLDKRHQIGSIIARHELLPSVTAYVGDMVHDIEAARAGEVTSIALLSGYDSLVRLAAAKPQIILPHIGELSALCASAERLVRLPGCQVRDDIVIQKLRVPVFIGVPDEERAKRQDVYTTVTMEVSLGISGLADEIAKTVDYFTVSERLKVVALDRPRQLIETLAEDFADIILDEFKVQAVKVEIEKLILVNCESVKVKLEKRR